MSQKYLFVDRDGTIITEPEDFQIDRFEKLAFEPGVIMGLRRLQEAGWRLVMVSNQDGLGTDSFPADEFWGPHNLMMQVLTSAGIRFDEILICPHKPEDNCECRKPKTKLLTHYLVDGVMDRDNCYVIGDRQTGKTAIAIVNLPPRKMMGEYSNGMLISAVNEFDERRCSSYCS